MAKDKTEKSNVMRLLEQKKAALHSARLPCLRGGKRVEVAATLGEPPERVFKTLVTTGASGGYHVFVIPVAEELDPKKAAKAVGEKASPCCRKGAAAPSPGISTAGAAPSA